MRDWWSETTNNQFNQLTQCMVDKYDNYTEEIDGRLVHVRHCLHFRFSNCD